MESELSDPEIIRPAVPGRRRRFSLAEKRRLIEETKEEGSSLSSVSRRYGLAPSQLFQWRRMMESGALAGLDSGEDVVPASEVKVLKAKIHQLERLLGKKTVEVEILKEAVEIGREKKLISRAPLRGVGDFK